MMYEADLPRFRALVHRFGSSGLVPSTGIDVETGKKVGGRPPVASETFRAILDAAEASYRPRARRKGERARRADEAARVAFGRLFRQFPTRLLPYRPAIERVVTQATGADRVQRRIEATIGFCERRLLGAFSVSEGRPSRLDLVLPTMVPGLYYGWGPVVYQSTLDAIEGVAT
jgi:glutathione S-transferase